MYSQEKPKPMGAFEPGTFTGDRNGCLIWFIGLMLFASIALSSVAWGQEPLEGPFRDAIVERIETRLSRHEKAQEKQAVEMQGVFSDWRREVQEARNQSIKDREAYADENKRFLQRLKEWTPGQDITKRLDDFVASLRGVVWQIALLGGAVFVVLLLALKAIGYILCKIKSLLPL